MNFGALNRFKGENRLNVAITRAQEKIELFTSILPHQFEVENSTHRGPKLLKQYIQYCMLVSNNKWTPSPLNSKIFKQNKSLKNKLVNLDTDYLELQKKYPFCDLIARNKTHEFGTILTDDDAYYQSKNIKEYHAYHQLYLKQKGWKVSKIHSRDYFLDQEALKMKLNKFGLLNETTI